MSKFGLTISEKRVRSLSSDDAHVTEQEYVLSVKPCDFLGFTHFCDKTKRQIQAWAKDFTQEVRTKDEDMNLWLKSIRNRIELKELWKFLGIKLLAITNTME